LKINSFALKAIIKLNLWGRWIMLIRKTIHQEPIWDKESFESFKSDEFWDEFPRKKTE